MINFRLNRSRSTAFLLSTVLVGLPVLTLNGHSAMASKIHAAESKHHIWKDGNGQAIISGEQYDPRTSLAPLLTKIRPTVVSITAVNSQAQAQGMDLPLGFPGQHRRSPGQNPGARSGVATGSGFVISGDGMIVTNHHVIENRDKLEVTLADGRTFTAKVLGSDQQTDVALIQLENASKLEFATLGTSKRTAVGDWVLAIGSPLGLEQTVTRGIVSAKGRGSLGLYRDGYADFLQTDAAISPGNSGGPLFNLNGEVVGINTAVAGIGNGLGFAVPIDQVKNLLPYLHRDGKFSRGWLGVTTQAVTPAVGERPKAGALVAEVHRGTPAAKAGIKGNDRIIAINDIAIEDFEDLRGRIGEFPPGSTLRVKVQRGAKNLVKKVRLQKRPSSESLARMGNEEHTEGKTRGLYGDDEPKLGISAQQSKKGIVVKKVMPGSLAEDLGLREGDIIAEVNGRRVSKISDIVSALHNDKSSLQVSVERGGQRVTSALRSR